MTRRAATKIADKGATERDFVRLAAMETDECVLWPHSTTPFGYGVATMDGRKQLVHKVALERRTPRPIGFETRHGPCHNPLCLNYRHLSWGTRAENQADRLRDGTDNRGEKHGLAKLTRDDVRAIRCEVSAGRRRVAIAEAFGISVGHVSEIVRRVAWAWLDPESASP